MARTLDQRRWRANTSKKRIELYLPADIAEALDARARSQGQSRAEVVARLIGQDRPAADAPAKSGDPATGSVPVDVPPTKPAQSPGNPPPNDPPADEMPATPPGAGGNTLCTPTGYRFRRPREADEKRRHCDWIAVAEDGTRLTLRRDLDGRWRGMYLDGGTWGIRPYTSTSRDQVTRTLLSHPEIYR